MQQSRIDSVTSLMDSLKLSIEQAMDALKIPMEDRDNLAAIINSR